MNNAPVAPLKASLFVGIDCGETLRQQVRKQLPAVVCENWHAQLLPISPHGWSSRRPFVPSTDCRPNHFGVRFIGWVFFVEDHRQQFTSAAMPDEAVRAGLGQPRWRRVACAVVDVEIDMEGLAWARHRRTPLTRRAVGAASAGVQYRAVRGIAQAVVRVWALRKVSSSVTARKSFTGLYAP
jgi:hypothetical protein